jgi:hypothetical protein
MTADSPNPYDPPQTQSHESLSSGGAGNTVVITPDIMVRAHKIHQRPRTLIVRVVVLFICLCFAANGVRFWLTGDHFAGGVLCAIALVPAVYVLLSGYRLRLTINRQYRQMGKQQDVVTYHTTPEYLHVATEDLNARIKWSDFIKWKEAEGLILAYRHERFFQVIPIEQLDADTKQAIRESLSAHSRQV